MIAMYAGLDRLTSFGLSQIVLELHNAKKRLHDVCRRSVRRMR